MTRESVKTSSGLVVGLPSEYDKDIIVYKGLPYAASTAGENRWRAPQPPPSWDGVRIADTFSEPCPQIPFGPMTVLPSQSEDCLSLNIWAPVKNNADLLPVYVWIYGGRFIAGSGSEHAYDGAGLASKGIVVVTMNYRVGILGFLAHPDLDEESGNSSSGNYGILDQVAALRWVQDNIAQFGGDPARVTIGGQSAGAASTAIHIMSPGSRGLFRAAIPQSGWRHPRDPLLSGLAPAYRTKEKALSQGKAIVKEKGAASIAELRKISLDVLLQGNNRNDDVWGNPPFYRPCIDGHVIPYNYEESMKYGILADLPILSGHNADEGGTYADPDFDASDMASCAKQKYGPLAEQFLKLYPISDSITAREAWNEAARDNSRVTLAMWAEEYHKHAKSPVYGYFYTHAPPARKGGPDAPPARGQAAGAAGPDSQPKLRIYENPVPRSEYTYSKIGPGARFGAFHGAEIPFVLNNLYAQDGCPYGDVDRKVAKTVSTYWANFIKFGNPNGDGLVQENFTETASGTIMSLGEECHTIPLAASPERIAFWREHLTRQEPW